MTHPSCTLNLVHPAPAPFLPAQILAIYLSSTSEERGQLITGCSLGFICNIVRYMYVKVNKTHVIERLFSYGILQKNKHCKYVAIKPRAVLKFLAHGS